MTPYLQGKNKPGDDGFLIRNHGGLKEWHNIFRVLKEKNCQPRILYRENILEMRNQDMLKENE